MIVSFFVPHCAPLEFVRPYKQARRREDDISIVSCALRVRLEPAQREGRGVWVVSDAALAYGGLAPTAVLAAKTADKLRGCTWDAAAVDALLPAVMSELAVPHDAPGGQPEYRTALAGSFLFKFFVATSASLATVAPAGSPPPPLVAEADASAAVSWLEEPKPASGGEQRFPHASYPGLESQSPGGKTAWGIEGPRAIEPPTASEKEARRGGDGGLAPKGSSGAFPRTASAFSWTVSLTCPMTRPAGADSDRVRVVGESHPHAAGRLHTTGEAEYTDDVRPPASPLAHGGALATRRPPTCPAPPAVAHRSALPLACCTRGWFGRRWRPLQSCASTPRLRARCRAWRTSSSPPTSRPAGRMRSVRSPRMRSASRTGTPRTWGRRDAPQPGETSAALNRDEPRGTETG